MQTYINRLTELFERNRNPDQAVPMQNYMKNHFTFLGIKTPLRNELQKQFFQETGLLKESFNHELVVRLWDKSEREYQYAALIYMEKSLKKLVKEDLLLMENLITTKSWWDSVDVLSPKPVGRIAQEFPEVIPERIEEWASNENMWMRRAAILFQKLKYKEETNAGLLYKIILQNSDSKEFFIQKAIGWALREYSKSNPASVKSFITANKLPALSVREGSKYI